MASDSLAAAAWMVDASRLRSTLDALHEALAKAGAPPDQIDPRAFLHDRKHLAETLRGVLDQINRAELPRKLTVSSLATEYRDPEIYRRLDETLRQLHATSRRRVLGALGEQKTATALRLLKLPMPDFLSVLGRADEENSHSDVLRWLLDPVTAPHVSPSTLLALTRRFERSEEWEKKLQEALATGTVSVRREFVYGREWASTQDLDRIDLLISGPGFVIAIENKLWAVEHDEQTVSYWEWLQTVPVLRAGVFLTPSGESASCPDFLPLSYMDMLVALLDAPMRGQASEAEELVLSSYVKTLSRTALRNEFRILQREER